MKETILSVLVVIVAVLGAVAYVQETEIQAQEQSIQQLGSKVETLSSAEALDLQSKCSRQAQEDYKSGGWEKDTSAYYNDHYDASLNKCFVFVHDIFADTQDPTTMDESADLYDAFELVEYGDFLQTGFATKNGAPPYCDVTLPSGQQATCHSEAEFRNLIKTYMGPDFN